MGENQSKLSDSSSDAPAPAPGQDEGVHEAPELGDVGEASASLPPAADLTPDLEETSPLGIRKVAAETDESAEQIQEFEHGEDGQEPGEDAQEHEHAPEPAPADTSAHDDFFGPSQTQAPGPAWDEHGQPAEGDVHAEHGDVHPEDDHAEHGEYAVAPDANAGYDQDAFAAPAPRAASRASAPKGKTKPKGSDLKPMLIPICFTLAALLLLPGVVGIYWLATMPKDDPEDNTRLVAWILQAAWPVSIAMVACASIMMKMVADEKQQS